MSINFSDELHQPSASFINLYYTLYMMLVKKHVCVCTVCVCVCVCVKMSGRPSAAAAGKFLGFQLHPSVLLVVLLQPENVK